MNSLQSRFLLVVAVPLISPQTYVMAQDMGQIIIQGRQTSQEPELFQLTRVDGATIVGHQRGANQFIDCEGHVIEIGLLDRIQRTNKTCQRERTENHPTPADRPSGGRETEPQSEPPK
jgi:hypothetical protein